MKKNIIIVLILSAIIGLSFYIAHIKNEQEKEKGQQLLLKQAEQALKERQSKYRTLRDISEEYNYNKQMNANLTTEDIGNSDLKIEFANSLIGKTFYLYINIIDIRESNGRREIIIANPSDDFYFSLYDNNKVIENAKKGDKIDIVVIAEKWFYEKNSIFKTINNLYIPFKVIELEENYGTSQPIIDGLLKDERLR